VPSGDSAGAKQQTRSRDRRGDRHQRRQRPGHHGAASRRGGDHVTNLVKMAPRVLQLQAGVTDVAQPLPPVTLEAEPQHVRHQRRGARGQAREVRVLVQHGADGVGGGLADERSFAGEQLVEHDAERPDVGALVDGSAAGLLRRHVGRRTEDHPGNRRRVHGRRHDRRAVEHSGTVARSGVERPGEPEVEHLDSAVRRELDVVWLEIAVDDARRVRGLDPGGELDRDLEGVFDRQRAGPEAIGQCLTLDILQDQEALPVLLLHAVDGRNVRVAQLGKRPCLALEAREPVGVRQQVLGQRLDRDVPVEPLVTRLVDDAHPAATDLAVDDIGADLLGHARHVMPSVVTILAGW
jgi:hypothetical protein